MNNVKRFLKTVGINVLILILLLKVIDLFLQDDKHPDIRGEVRQIHLKEIPPDSDFIKMPDDDYMAKTENLTQKPYRIRTDSNGYIIGPHDVSHKPKSIEIIFFGGSTTECRFVDEDKRFPYLAGEMLSKKLGREISVRNAGVSGKNTMQSTLDFIVKGIPLSPGIMVIMHNINDLAQLIKTGSYWEGPKSRALIHVNDDKNINDLFLSLKNIICPNLHRRITMLKYTDFYRFLRSKSQPKTLTVDEWEGFRHFNPVNYSNIENQYANAISSFIRLAKVYDIEVVLMTQFNRINLNDRFIVNTYRAKENAMDFKTFSDYYERFNNKIREISKKENVLLIDLADLVPSNRHYIYDTIHLNNAGSVLAAEIIAEKIEARFYKLN